MATVTWTPQTARERAFKDALETVRSLTLIATEEVPVLDDSGKDTGHAKKRFLLKVEDIMVELLPPDCNRHLKELIPARCPGLSKRCH
jgi:hypothetical protein